VEQQNPIGPRDQFTTDAVVSVPSRNYPLARPESDPRFNFGLLLEVARAVQGQGYPEFTGRDLVDLRQKLFEVLYAEGTSPGELADGVAPVIAPARAQDHVPPAGSRRYPPTEDFHAGEWVARTDEDGAAS
jgi:hypothetical protein